MCWIIPLIVGLLSALLGYLLGKRKVEEYTQRIAHLNEENATLRGQLSDCENEKAKGLSDEAVKNHTAYQSLNAKYAELKSTGAAQSDQQAGLISELQAENQRLTQALNHCENNLAEAKSNRAANMAMASPIASFAAGAVTAKAFDADAAKAAFGKTIKEDDLTVVEGIGPKIAELFHQANINTWQQLSETSVEACQKILDDAGDRFAIHNPNTWPRQAKLAADGQWQELFDWQEILDGGRE